MRLVRASYGDPDVVALVARVQEEYVVRYGSRDETPLDPAMFEPPEGTFFVGHEVLDGVDGIDGIEVPVATGAWRRSTVNLFGGIATAEIKRMYVVPEARGRGLSRVMLAHLEQTASAAGIGALVLETGIAQPEAIALYVSAGYERVPQFGYYRDSPSSRCFGKLLRGGAERSDAG